MEENQNTIMVTSVNVVKEEEQIIRQMEKAADDLFSTTASTIRQLVKSFFMSLNERTSIQRATKVRSIHRLLVYTMGTILIAFISYFFYCWFGLNI